MKKQFAFIGGVLAGALAAYIILDVLNAIKKGNDFLNPPRPEANPTDAPLWIG